MMQSCWEADANERPPFSVIREKFQTIMERSGETYGYMPLIVENDDTITNVIA